MKTRLHPRTTAARRLWTGRVWPVLAGAVTAVGILAAGSALGPLLLLVVYAALSVFAVVTVWGLSLELGTDRSSVVRIGLYAALVVVVLSGLCQLLPRFGMLVAAVVGVTSPAALGLMARVRSRPARRPTGRAAPGVLVDTAMLNRRFDDIVNQLRASGDFPEA